MPEGSRLTYDAAGSVGSTRIDVNGNSGIIRRLIGGSRIWLGNDTSDANVNYTDAGGVSINIQGNSSVRNVYGGSIIGTNYDSGASQLNGTASSVINGDVDITVGGNAVIDGNIYGGGLVFPEDFSGWKFPSNTVKGDVTVTFKGSAPRRSDDTAFDGFVYGASDEDITKVEGLTSVIFDGKTGEFNGNVRGVKKLLVKNNSNFTFGGTVRPNYETDLEVEAGSRISITQSASVNNLVNNGTLELPAGVELYVKGTNTGSGTVTGGGSIRQEVIKPVSIDVTANGDNYILVGASRQLYADVYPAAADGDVTWSSSNTELASVDSNGLITAALKAGTVVITAASVHDDGVKGSITMEVVLPPITEMKFIPGSSTLRYGQSADIYELLQVSPELARKPERGEIEWHFFPLMDPPLASIENGVITALGYDSSGIAAANYTDSSGWPSGAAMNVDLVIAGGGEKTETSAPSGRAPSGLPSETADGLAISPIAAKYPDSTKQQEVSEAIGIGYWDLMSTGEDKLGLNESTVKQSVANAISRDKSIEQVDIVSFAIVSEDLNNNGEVAAIGYEVTGEVFGSAKSIDEIKVLKTFPTGAGQLFTVVKDKSQFKDKCVTLMKGGDIHTGEIVSGDSYTLVTFIKDGGEFDLDGAANGVVIDPVAVLRLKALKTTLSIHTRLEGRESGGGTGSNIEKMEVEIYDSDNVRLWGGVASTDADGIVSFDIAPEYVNEGDRVQLWVKGERCLAVLLSADVHIVDGIWNVTMTENLKGGDADGSNEVALDDFLILRSSILDSKGDPDFDYRADFDSSDTVDLDDFVILRRNILDSGAQKPVGARTALLLAANSAGNLKKTLEELNAETSTEQRSTANGDASGGCSTGAGALILLLALPFIAARRRK
ncbi:MAG: Ig-like domain-containing protein [Synergistaceae bacterium]|nr:Ig-like domain-containing protein [Synergistaceae bacterium]